ncbi:MAG: protein translocase subunit SecD [Candidatus Chisholmbacteria bacterium]|nr:protein translocase subunit SecD [Candidatus Chisholmbacteria bacterium]
MKLRPIALVAFLLLLVSVVLLNLPENLPVNIHQGPINLSTTIRRPPLKFDLGPWHLSRDTTIRQGLDLQGGTEVVLKLDMTNIPDSDRDSAWKSAEEVIRRRVDLFGVAEPVIQRIKEKDDYRLSVQLPGIKNIDSALSLIGQTAQLDFRELNPDLPEASSAAELLTNLIPTGLTGQDLRRAQVQFDQRGTGEALVGLEFSEDGAKKFADITQRNIGKPVAIFLDDIPLSAPIVQQEITDGNAVITGGFTTEQARELAVQLNAGALPTPIEIVSERSVGPTLGAESVQKSISAGLIGLTVVVIFMVAYYGKLGLVAASSLLIYGLITLSLYRLIPITLTLPGLAGFILSVGMAVDSNILIFERLKEELRLGKPWALAVELGFGRAWDSIKDANLATLITAFILFNPLNWSFLPLSGLVRGFAITLGLGIIVSLFTGVVISRSLIRFAVRGKK